MTNTTPVLLLGGQENTLAIARSLGRRGIAVDLSAEDTCIALQSRYARNAYVYRDRKDAKPFWRHLLIEGGAPQLHGHMVLACSDDGIEFLAEHASLLRHRYVLDRNRPELQLAMLDKQKTMELARATGCPVPNFWPIGNHAELEAARAQVAFPAVLKPIHSHVFQRLFDRKLFILNSLRELDDAASQAFENRVSMLLCEMVPGPDDLLSSYYTYIDEQGRSLFSFTKRIIRRFPVNRGLACYHVTEWLPETAAAGEKFFRGIGFRGLGNVEFKRELPGGALKLIECNARFTAAQELLVRAGVDTAYLVYCHLTGQPLPRLEQHKQQVRLWYPERDFNAFRELRRAGQLTTVDWLSSIAHPKVMPHQSLADPLPMAVHLWRRVRDHLHRRALV